MSNIEPAAIHQTMAQQIDHMKPDHLVPGKDIGIEVRDANSITVVIPSWDLTATVEYLPGPDLYAVEVLRDGSVSAHSEVYCDQLGELIFGDEAKPWTQPVVAISDDEGESWTVIA